MEVRIRKIIKPIAYFFAVLFQKLNLSSKFITAFFYFLILITCGVLLWLSFSPFSETLIVLFTIFIFITGFFDEIKREFTALYGSTKDKFILNNYEDLLIIFLILNFLNLGSYKNIYATQFQHVFIGVLLFFGFLLLNYLVQSAIKKDRTPGLEVPAERLLILSMFTITGYTHNSLEDYLLIGLIVLTFLIYWNIIYIVFQNKIYLIVVAFTSKVVSPTIEIFSKVSNLLRIILEELYRIFKKIGFKNEVRKGKKKSWQDHEETFESESGGGYNFTTVILDSDTEKPISNTNVELSNLESNDIFTNFTDAEGKCIFTEVKEGQYLLSIDADDYNKIQFERYISIDSGETFRLSKSPMDLSVVVNDFYSSSPISNAQVIIKGEDGNEVDQITDNLGVAYFDNINSNFFNLRVTSGGYTKVEKRINIKSETVVTIKLKKEEISKSQRSYLIEYEDDGDLEDIIDMVINKFDFNKKDIYLVSSGNILKNFDNKGVRPIDFSSTLAEDVESLIGGISSEATIIFEAFTELVHRVGLDDSLSFMEDITNHIRKKELNIIVLINKKKHGENITSMFRKFFLFIAEIRNGKLVEINERI